MKKGRANLAPRDDPNIIDIEFETQSEIDKDIEYYSAYLRQYEIDQQEITRFHKEVAGKDIFTNEYA